MHKRVVKSQAALEFLITYGWAVLTMLIMVAALAYFGILNPDRLLPDRCNFASEVGCKEQSIVGNGVNLRLTNGMGEEVIIDGVNFSIENTNLRCNSSMTGKPWFPGETRDFYNACDFTGSNIAKGQRQKLNVQVVFHAVSSSSSYGRSTQGEMISTVQSGYVPKVIGDFELGSIDSFGAYGDGIFSSTSQYGSIAGLSSLYVKSDAGGVCSGNFCGVYVFMLPKVVGQTYTISYWAKAIANTGGIAISIQNGAGDQNCLAHTTTITNQWRKYTKTCTLDIVKNIIYIWSQSPSQEWVIDDLQIIQG